MDTFYFLFVLTNSWFLFLGGDFYEDLVLNDEGELST